MMCSLMGGEDGCLDMLSCDGLMHIDSEGVTGDQFRWWFSLLKKDHGEYTMFEDVSRYEGWR
jgi:hypothetical protein